MNTQSLIDQITEARNKLSEALNHEQRMYDALPVEMQMSPVGDAIETKIERMMDGIASMDEALSSLRDLQFISPN